MNKGIVKEGILGVLKLRWYSLFKNYRKRVKKRKQTILLPILLSKIKCWPSKPFLYLIVSFFV